MIRKTCTGSLVLVAGGWSLVALAVLYGLIDVAKIGGWAFPFVVLGMNPLLIYLVSESLVRRWILQTEPAVAVSLLVLLIEWGLCYLLYRKGRFIRV